MNSVTLVSIALAAAAAFWLEKYLKAKKDNRSSIKCLPPGPTGLPLIGYLPFLNPFSLGESFKRLANKYGSVFSLSVGTEHAVVLNDYESIKSVFSRPEFNNRPDTFMFRYFSLGNTEQRKFVTKHLKSLTHRSNIQDEILDEVKSLMGRLDVYADKMSATEIGTDLNVSVSNIVWSTISGQRASPDDRILLFMPWLLNYLPESLFNIDIMSKLREKTFSYIENIISEHQALDPEGSQDSDLVYAFLKEMRLRKESSFTKKQLLVLCTKSVSLKWALRILALNPELTRRAQKEIDESIGKDRFHHLRGQNSPSFSSSPNHGAHSSGGYSSRRSVRSARVERRSGLLHSKWDLYIPEFHAVHGIPVIGDPAEVIRPEHWISFDGTFNPHHAGFIASVPARNCPGQELALMQLFLFLGNLFQRYSFEFHMETLKKVEGTPGILFSPKP
ncbi:Cytochrome P450 CYP3029A1 [Caligus rogercresseyi]|uniref:Cytochrome P450 CYP3029A1 n=1 Tax=Caligus rogercresseyi TaxID=217165 RepID=A0A7T8GL45_CALRO|nr:Cytochrome P450 CYP3029A1 [Caligus rogercresseyi]